MPNSAAQVRRGLGTLLFVLFLVGMAGWAGYNVADSAHRKAVAKQQDAENLRRMRYWEALDQILLVGEMGDETTRKRCRKALNMLEMVEPDWYSSWALVVSGKIPPWVKEPMGESK